MARTDRSRKRQKTSHHTSYPVADDTEKDDEEQELEARLFGTKSVIYDDDEEEEDGRMDDRGRELEGMLDEDVCLIHALNFPHRLVVALLCG
jgi:hypothetical protein